jgi:glycosyltransferase involved in cell wall biosynthesis
LSRLLFISTHNFATNPRLVKEVELALDNGYMVSVICCSFDGWSKANNERIKERLINSIDYHEVSGTRHPFLPWLLSSFWYKLSPFFLAVTGHNQFFLSLASNKRSWLLLQELKNIKKPINMIIAHNPGSFHPAQWFAKKNKIPFGIDLEDYHPGETNDADAIERFKKVNKAILPTADYISAAAPLILSYSKNDLDKPLKKEELILNYFPGSEFLVPQPAENDNLNIVWFSQNISHGRGLEEFIPVFKKTRGFTLHLYGNMDKAFEANWLKGVENIYYHGALPQVELHHQLRKYDIGLALEKAASNLNRDLCITNKILAYQQAGLFILASKTKAQVDFINANPRDGMLTGMATDELANALGVICAQKENIKAAAVERFTKNRSLNWETESTKLLDTWKQLINYQGAEPKKYNEIIAADSQIKNL